MRIVCIPCKKFPGPFRPDELASLGAGHRISPHPWDRGTVVLMTSFMCPLGQAIAPCNLNTNGGVAVKVICRCAGHLQAVDFK